MSPIAVGPSEVDATTLVERELFGSYARALGWSRGRAGGTGNDPTRHIRVAQV